MLAEGGSGSSFSIALCDMNIADGNLMLEIIDVSCRKDIPRRNVT